MASVTVTFTTSGNVQVAFWLSGVSQTVDTNNSPLVFPDIAVGQYGMEVKITAKDGGVGGGGNCQTVVTEQGRANPIGQIPALLNTISAGSTSDTAVSTFTVA